MFPMIPEKELEELAADSQTDGRNRLEACRRAGVKPRFGKLNDIEPIPYPLLQRQATSHDQGLGSMIAAKVRLLN
jgi:hypothetical protein